MVSVPQVRTLFVSGLPVDIKPRELYLLFRPFKVSLDPAAHRQRRNIRSESDLDRAAEKTEDSISEIVIAELALCLGSAHSHVFLHQWLSPL